jgi:RNA polymerase sigma-70 factor, ECF subfamily
VTDFPASGHFTRMLPAPGPGDVPEAPAAPDPQHALQHMDFAEVYRAHFDFVWRSLRRLGVPEPQLEDSAQEVFLVIHRRLSGFEGRSSLKSWIFGIVLRVASQARRTTRRRPEQALPADLVASERFDPHEATAQAQARELVYQLLEELDDEKRVVFILAELEQMTVPEIAEAIAVKVNTVYSRLRAARREFELALAARRAPDSRRQP